MRDKIIKELDQNKIVVKEVLKGALIPFAFITGKYELEGSKYEIDINSNYVPDIDIIIFSAEKTVIKKLISAGFIPQTGNTYLFKNDHGELINIDFYFNWICLGVIKIIKPSYKSVQNNKISEYEYLLYQTLEPLLKFGEYKKRHLIRLQLYKENSLTIHLKVKKRLFLLCFPISFIIKNAIHSQSLSKKHHFLLKVLFIIKPYNIINYIQFKYFNKWF